MHQTLLWWKVLSWDSFWNRQLHLRKYNIWALLPRLHISSCQNRLNGPKTLNVAEACSSGRSVFFLCKTSQVKSLVRFNFHVQVESQSFFLKKTNRVARHLSVHSIIFTAVHLNLNQETFIVSWFSSVYEPSSNLTETLCLMIKDRMSLVSHMDTGGRCCISCMLWRGLTGWSACTEVCKHRQCLFSSIFQQFSCPFRYISIFLPLQHVYSNGSTAFHSSGTAKYI